MMAFSALTREGSPSKGAGLLSQLAINYNKLGFGSPSPQSLKKALAPSAVILRLNGVTVGSDAGSDAGSEAATTAADHTDIASVVTDTAATPPPLPPLPPGALECLEQGTTMDLV